MPIQLDKILADVAQEKVLHPNYPGASKQEVDDAWMRVGRTNKLSVHEARSIFKVLQKKYEQEKLKGKSAWKLYGIMDDIHRKVEVKPVIKEEVETELPIEEDEEFEMLEVQEEDDHITLPQSTAPNSTGSASDSESLTKSNSSHSSPEKDEKPVLNKPHVYGKTQSSLTAASSRNNSVGGEEKKLLNNIAMPRLLQSSSSTKASVMQRKGITLKKAVNNSGSSPSNPQRSCGPLGNCKLEVGKTIQLPESIKRKLSEEQKFLSQQQKKFHMSSENVAVVKKASSSAVATTATPQKLLEVKREPDDEDQTEPTHRVNLITIPANLTRSENEIGQSVTDVAVATSSTAATVASTSSLNGYSPRIQDIDFKNDIIFDTRINGETAASNGNGSNISGNSASAANKFINLGNFDNSLPPTFFKNLCNSSRHEALGLYVANVMNRVRPRSAAKLELAILRAIVDVQSDEFEQ